MKQSIQLRLGQHLTMTPQLQQAIRLLQLSAVDLQTEIQEALDSNLMLEATDDATTSESDAQSDGLALDEGLERDRINNAEIAKLEAEALPSTQTDIPEELPVDSAWEDVYESVAAPTGLADANQADYEIQRGASETLRDHLMWQLNLTPLGDTDRIIATVIVDAIQDDGYLGTSLEEIRQGLVEHEGLELEADEVEAVLRSVQNFDPTGVAARNPKECLQIQLQQIDPGTPWLAEARQLVDQYLDLLAAQQYQQLKRKMKLPDEALHNAIDLVRSLNPRPGRLIEDNQTQYITPDVFVQKKSGVWKVELNPEASPRLKINAHYASLVRRADNSDDNVYLKNHLQEARWFLKSLQSRNETLLKVATSIVEHQRAFLEYGEEAMKPLVLRDVAEDVAMHESTISRVTTQKYMRTPRGIFELKYFFSSHVGTSGGGECSATAIRALIKKLVAAEKPNKPLSDNKIAEILSEQGINVARRTVAKYRESMAIPPSNERKRLI